MQLSTSQAAAQLGVTARQVRRSASDGRIVGSRAGAAHTFSSRQILALNRTAHRGRDWTKTTQDAALDLLATGKTSEYGSSAERSRLKTRVRSASVGALAGQLLRDRVSLRRAANADTTGQFSATLTSDLGLSAGGGLGVLVAVGAQRAARQARLGRDDAGDIAVLEGRVEHTAILEALALYAYGDARESSAAAAWIADAQKAL